MRIKYVMQAPQGTSEAIIDGVYYWPDPDGRVDITTPDHVRTLRLHGFELIAEQEFAPPPTAFGLINFEEMGKTELLDALRERGVSYPLQYTRFDLEEAASGWNAARKGPRAPTAEAPTPVMAYPELSDEEREVLRQFREGKAKAEPERVMQPIAASTAEPTDEQIATMGVRALRAYLTSVNVAFNPATNALTLRKIVRAEVEKRKAA